MDNVGSLAEWVADGTGWALTPAAQAALGSYTLSNAGAEDGRLLSSWTSESEGLRVTVVRDDDDDPVAMRITGVATPDHTIDAINLGDDPDWGSVIDALVRSGQG